MRRTRTIRLRCTTREYLAYKRLSTHFHTSFSALVRTLLRKEIRRYKRVLRKEQPITRT